MIGGISHEAICAVQAYHRSVIERQRQRFEAVTAAQDEVPSEADSGATIGSNDWHPPSSNEPHAAPMSV